jgi:hypothetical protein
MPPTLRAAAPPSRLIRRDKAQAAIKANNAAAIKGNGSGSAMYVALYCGQNE